MHRELSVVTRNVIAGPPCHINFITHNDAKLSNFREALIYGKELTEPAYFQFIWGKDVIGSFGITTMPFCCGIAVMGNVWLSPEHRGKPISYQFREMRGDVVRMLGYSAVVATTQVKNTAAVKNFAKVGYTEALRFVNKRTTNEIILGCKEIK